MAEETPAPAAEVKPDAPVVEGAGDTPAEAPATEPATPEPDKTYTQSELDKILAKVKKNERYRTKKEIEAFYQGRESAAPKPVEKPAPVVEDKPPTREQYPHLSFEEFTEVKADWVASRATDRRMAEREKEAQERAASEAADKKIRDFDAKVNEKFPDISEFLNEIPAGLHLPDLAGEAVIESPLGEEIMNFLIRNPKDFERIAALSPSAASREVGKLEARLEGAAQKPAPAAVPKPSAAPAPLKPVGGTAVLGDSEPSHNNPDEWRKWRDKQVHKRSAGSAK